MNIANVISFTLTNDNIKSNACLQFVSVTRS